MSSIELVADTDTDTDPDADTDASVSVAVVAALGDLTRAVDVLQQHSLDGLRDEDLLGVLQQLERQRRRLATVDHRLITELLHIDVGEAKARVRAAAVLGPRTALPEPHRHHGVAKRAPY